MEELILDYRDYLNFAREVGKRIHPSIMGEELKSLTQRRYRYKREMRTFEKGTIPHMALNIKQASAKLLTLSSYGVVGYRGMRLFNEVFFNSVTGMARHIIETMEDYFKKYGDVLYCDTDSVFLEIKEKKSPLLLIEEFLDMVKEANSFISEYLKEKFSVEECEVVLEPKNFYEAAVFTAAKKKYRGDTLWVEGDYTRDTDLVGFEAKRDDSFTLLSEVQMDLQRILFDTPAEKLESTIINYLRTLKEGLHLGWVDDKLVQEKTLRKYEIGEYEHEDPHVRSAKKLQEKGILRSGDKVAWVVVEVDKKKGMREEPIDPRSREVVPKIEESGYDYYFKRILMMVSRLIGTPVKEIEKKLREDVQGTVEGFLKI